MFRTLVVKSDLVKSSARKSIRANITRNFTIQCAKKLQKCSRQPLMHNFTRKTPSFYQVRHYADLPNHTKVNLPALSPTMEQGTIVSWTKKEGDKLNEGDLLAEIETDKATMGFETPEEGYLAKILIPEGTKDVPIGKLVCIIVENEADVAAFKDYKGDDVGVPAPKPAAPTPSAPTPSTVPVAVPAGQPPSPVVADATGRVYASPMAKRLAEQRNIRLQGKGTGLFGSITSSDLDRVAAASAHGIQAPAVRPPTPAALPGAASLPAPPPPAPGVAYTDIPLTNMRATIAKRLLQSKQTIPHYYVSIDCNVDNLLKLREEVNKKADKLGVRVSVNDFVIKAAATALIKVPELNTYWMDSFIRQFHSPDICVAVATPNGLITPKILEAHKKGVVEISKLVKELAEKARNNKLQPHEFQGGSFTISSLGMFGVDHFCAIISPPQSSILAVSSARKTLAIDETSEKGFKQIQLMNVTLSCDHRVVDGAVAARWMSEFRHYIEDPISMIL